MPELPSNGVWTRYVLENPWPLAIVLLAIAALAAWSGFREGIAFRQKAAGALALVACGILTIGHLVVTAGEHARAATVALVHATVNKDLIATSNVLAPNAVVSFGQPSNPGFDRDYIMERLDAFRQKYTIDSNTISSLKTFGESPTAAVVHLDCWSQVTTSFGPAPVRSQWILRVEKQSDPAGEWKIARVTLVAINNQTHDGNF